jgi:hypothetical protein
MIRADPSVCEKALCSRTMATGTEGRSARVSVYAVPQNAEGVSLLFLFIDSFIYLFIFCKINF